MKFLVSQLTYLLRERRLRKDLGVLAKYLAFVTAVVALHSVLFHVIMLHAEGREHSWLTGVYWTLTVMSTLGFGDITFHTDVGRLFSLVVLLSGMVLLLIVLPVTFIQHFYAPWLEARIRLQAPRAAAPDLRGHVIVCRHDSIAPGLIRKLEFNRVPYLLIEPDPVVAARMASDGLRVVTGEIDSRATYDLVRAAQARLVFANAADTTNTNITLTVREAAPVVPLLALAEDEDSIDILELSGATRVLPLKHRLGEQLASRTSAGAGSTHVVGRFKDLLIVEFAVHHTPLAGRSLREARLRELTGVNVVAVWRSGRLQPARPDEPLAGGSIPVAIGTADQITRLKARLGEPTATRRPALVIGAGKVGQAAAAALKGRGVPVHVVEKEDVRRGLAVLGVDRVVIGDAADRRVLQEAGLEDVAAVVLTTNDDAVNIYLTVYCRRLRPQLSIVSRITYERNVEALYRAGADSVLSYASLGREHVIAFLLGREPVMVGEGADFFLAEVPAALVGQSLSGSDIGARTGLIVIAIEDGPRTLTNPDPATPLPRGAKLLMLGTPQQRESFDAVFA